MNKNTISFILMLAFLSLVLGGCAAKPRVVTTVSKPYEWNDQSSFALNIMKTLGPSNLRDSAPASAKESDPSLVGAAVAGWAGSGSSTPASLGLGSIAGAGLNILTFAIPKDTMESRSFGFVWLPKSTGDKAQVRALVMKQVVEAMHKAVAKVKLPEGYHFIWTDPEHKPTSVDIRGGKCVNGALCIYNIELFRETYSSLAPKPLGGKESWMQYLMFLPSISYKPAKILYRREDVLPDFQIYRELSANLPGNYFIYLAPSQTKSRISIQTSSGFVALRVPLLLNAGKIHQFIKPRGQ